MSILKIWKFKKSVSEEKRKVFKDMQVCKDKDTFAELKDKYATYDKISHPGGHISKDVLLSTTASVAMLLLTLHYEKLDIITSKCWGWIRPPKS